MGTVDTVRTVVATLLVGLIAVNIALFVAHHPVPSPAVVARRMLVRQVAIGAVEVIRQANDDAARELAQQRQRNGGLTDQEAINARGDAQMGFWFRHGGLRQRPPILDPRYQPHGQRSEQENARDQEQQRAQERAIETYTLAH